ncbi:hypothetical protein BH09SUM1_BH09SUM1_27050 [soil metagenome]
MRVVEMPFTPGWKDVMRHSRNEAERLGHGYIGAEHFLLGIVRKGEGLAVKMLLNMGVDLDKLRSALEKKLQRGTGSNDGIFSENMEAIRVIASARSISGSLKHNWLGTEHLLIALAKDAGEPVHSVLEESGVDFARARKEALVLIGGPHPDEFILRANLSRPQGFANGWKEIRRLMSGSSPDAASGILLEGKHLRLVRDANGWEHVERTNSDYAVVIAALTAEGNVLLVEQFRPPVKSNVIEFPAGLVGDLKDQKTESVEAAARRELLEETGYEAAELVEVARGPVSPGLSTEMIILMIGNGLKKVAKGGGVDAEKITVHEIPLAGIRPWLAERAKEGAMVDAKIFGGLYFLDLIIRQDTSYEAPQP